MCVAGVVDRLVDVAGFTAEHPFLIGQVRCAEGAVTLAVGADNILDEYPDAAPIGLNGTGNTPFSTYSPFGYSGRFVYTKATVNF